MIMRWNKTKIDDGERTMVSTHYSSTKIKVVTTVSCVAHDAFGLWPTLQTKFVEICTRFSTRNTVYFLPLQKNILVQQITFFFLKKWTNS